MELTQIIIERLHGKQKPNGIIECFCPGHEMPDIANHKPSLIVNVEKETAFCMSKKCYSGSIGYKEVMKYLGIDIEVSNLTDCIDRNKLAIYQKEFNGVSCEQLMWNKGVCKQLGIGFHRGTFYIPVFHKGFIVTVQRYRPEKDPKYYIDKIHNCPAVIYPERFIRSNEDIFITEGFGDCIALRSAGYNAVTSGGTSSWTSAHSKALKEYYPHTVYLLPDKDKAGENFGKYLSKEMDQIQLRSKWLDLPTKYGTDVSDCLRQGKSDILLFSPKTLNDETAEDSILQGSENFAETKLMDTLSNETGKAVHLQAILMAKNEKIYKVPQKITIDCCSSACKTCSACDYISGANISLDPETILYMIGTSNTQFVTRLKAQLNISKHCPGFNYSCADEDILNITEGVIGTPLQEQKKGAAHEFSIMAYIIGHDIKVNEVYDFYGCSLINPNDQSACMLIVKTKSVSRIGKEDTCPILPYENCFDTIDDIQYNVTEIYHREMMHLTLLLTLFSPLYTTVFEGGEPIKTYMESLILGDSHCGKSYAIRRLFSFYQEGAVVNSARATIPGILGGVKSFGSGKRMASAGTMAMMDGKAMCIEEIGSIGPEFMKALRDTRESGLVELDTIEKATFRARTRFIATANPSGGRVSVGSYLYGIEGVFSVTPYLPDIRRFDHIHIVKLESEEEMEDLRERGLQKIVPGKYTAEIGQKHLAWVWNLTPEDIIFQKETYTAVREQASILGRKGHNSIPIFTLSSAKNKLIKMAIAFAAFSGNCTEDRKKLIVSPIFVNMAAQFVDFEYSDPANGYFHYAEDKRRLDTIKNPEKLIESINVCFVRPKDAVLHLLNTRDFGDYNRLKNYLDKECMANLSDTLYREFKYSNCFRQAGHAGLYKTEAFNKLMSGNIIEFLPKCKNFMEQMGGDL